MQLAQSIVLTFGFLRSVSHGASMDWCGTIYRCKDVTNTMCAFQGELVNRGQCSDQHDLVQTDKNVKAYWLALHNTFRDQVAAGYVPGLPSAADMMQLQYDDLLTLQARRWAFQCKYEDDPCSRSPKYNKLQPEIVYNETRLLGDLVNDTRAAVLARFLENIDGYHSFPNNLIKKFDASSFEHHQQVNFVIHAFAKLRDIGASLIMYKWSEGGALYPFLKSNTYYGPPIHKGPLYMRGEPCSKCPDGFMCKSLSTYPHLCATAQDPSSDEYADGLPGAHQHKMNGATNPHTYSSMLLASIFSLIWQIELTNTLFKNLDMM